MKEDIENLVNAFYKQWCLTNDPFEEDFEGLLESLMPNYTLHFNIGTHEWILI